MATIKLTLSVKDDTVEWAKKYARRNHTSVSKIVQNHLENIKKEVNKDPLHEKIHEEDISPEILALTGILKGKIPADVNLWDAKYEYLKKKNDL
ncbi:MAG: hypothetical protein JWP37_3284 [Mucilaginibacter sp.]|nr:hypothetical protein [Mucilaginibacter sp.]